MRKKLFPSFIGLLSIFMFAACSKDDGPKIIDTSNDEVFALMNENYYWALPDVNKSLSTVQYFNALLSPEDKYVVEGETRRYSQIMPATGEIPTPTVTYDIGFEYAANKYSDGGWFYVILYVKPNTDAENQRLQRGYLISTVNGIGVTEKNKETLLKEQLLKSVAEFKPVKLRVSNPGNASLDISVIPSQNYVENSVLLSKVIPNTKTGYIVYNTFAGDFDFDLLDKLSQMKNAGVTDLVIDLRYNIGGGAKSAQKFASAIVKDNATLNVFMTLIKSRMTDNLNFISDGMIPTDFGAQLNKIYIITGQSTAGIPESFINALKPYCDNNLVIVGEKTKGRPIVTGTAKT